MSYGLAPPLKPDAFTYTAAISACAESAQWEAALKLLAELRGSGIRLGTIAFSKAIAALAKAGRWAEAVDVLADISREQLRREEHIIQNIEYRLQKTEN